MTGHVSLLQNSAMLPYSRLIWLKKSTAGGSGRRPNDMTAPRFSMASGGAGKGGKRGKEGHTVDGEPLVEVLALGQLDGLPQVAATERLHDVLMQPIARRPCQEAALRLKRLVVSAAHAIKPAPLGH